MAALVTGYDVAGRFGAAFTPRRSRTRTDSLAAAAAAAGARVWFDAAGVSLAMRIATTLVLTPSYNNAVAGATALNVAGGMGSFACALAPDLARAGFTAQENAIEEALGSLVGAGFRTDGLLDEIGARWEITRNYFRLYACCNPINPALDSLQEALRTLKPRADDIERIDVVTYRFAAVMCNPDPPNYFASKYSLPHAAATLIVRGSASSLRSTIPRCRTPSSPPCGTRAHVRRPGDDRGIPAAAAGTRDRDAERRPPRHARVRQLPRRLHPPVRGARTARKIPRACGHRADGGGRGESRAGRGPR